MDLYYLLSSDVNLPVKFNILSLSNLPIDPSDDVADRDEMSATTRPVDHELYIVASVSTHSVPLASVGEICSSYRCFPPGQPWVWNEWITVPLKYRDVDPDTVLHLRVVVACTARAIASCSVALFEPDGTVRFGLQRIPLRTPTAGSPPPPPPPPPGLCSTAAPITSPLQRTIRHYSQRPLPRVGWLDALLVPAVRRADQAGRERAGAAAAAAAAALPTIALEFPWFPHPIVHHERSQHGTPGTLLTTRQTVVDAEGLADNLQLRIFHDPEIVQTNPIDDKLHKLARSLSGCVHKNLKPKVSDRNQLRRIIGSPNKTLLSTERELLWRFRFTLIEDQHALTKFLRCVDWGDQKEASQACDLMTSWAPIDIADALELLSAYFANPLVRRYAVQRLEQAADDQLDMYLLQLVQALRWENGHPSDLSRFLIRRCAASIDMASHLHWFVHVEQQSSSAHGPLYGQVQADFLAALHQTDADQSIGSALERQHDFRHKLIELAASVSQSKRERFTIREERLRAYLAVNSALRCLPEPVPIPVRPDIAVTGVVSADLFKSSMTPLGLTCSTTHEQSQFRVLYKSGDDLRQDQLIIQMISLMDQILKRVNLDLRLTPYKVLATSTTDGFVELVPNCRNLSTVLAEYDGSIRAYFEALCNHKPNELQSILDAFVKSCAGYCVITYILGVGDRHLDNLLLTTSGQLFHIDFGFIFGRDPKHFPPPIKLTKEMVEAMGGAKSAHYHAFEAYCCQAFNILRKNASLILNLLSLMTDSGLPDLTGDADRTLLKIQDKFRLDLADDEAEQFFLKLIAESVRALFPQVVETMHRWALYWK